MKGNEKAIISGALVAIVAVGFYMLVLSPKRAEVSELNDQVTSLEASIDEQEQLVSFGEQARKEFPRDYGRLVVLGKAVPEQADTASLLVQLNGIADRTDVEFRAISLGEGASEASGTTTAPAPTTPPPSGGETSGSAGSTATPAASSAPAPAPATEASAANLPIGAVVGTAGLPTLPYNLNFTGGFFGVADYMGRLDDLIQFEDGSGEVKVNGRLMTVDGFALSGGSPGSNPTLDASFMLTAYVTPFSEGLTAGASPSGPALGGAIQTTPASQTVAP